MEHHKRRSIVALVGVVDRLGARPRRQRGFRPLPSASRRIRHRQNGYEHRGDLGVVVRGRPIRPGQHEDAQKQQADDQRDEHFGLARSRHEVDGRGQEEHPQHPVNEIKEDIAQDMRLSGQRLLLGEK